MGFSGVLARRMTGVTKAAANDTRARETVVGAGDDAAAAAAAVATTETGADTEPEPELEPGPVRSSKATRIFGGGNERLVGEVAVDAEAEAGEVAAEDGEAMGEGLMRLGSEM